MKLKNIMAAHGGLEKWQQIKEIVVQLRTGGWALPCKGQRKAFREIQVKIFPEQPYGVISPFPEKGFQGGFYRNKVWIENISGDLLQERYDPQSYFKKMRRKIYWDDLDVLYFGAYALWNYLTFPFFLIQPGFEVEELEPWSEKNETWHRLLVSFPPGFPTHCPKQIFFFNEEGLLMRQDYTAEVLGSWAKAAHYCFDHKNYSGIIFPTRRRVWPRFGNKVFRGLTLVALDIEGVEVVKTNHSSGQ